MLKTFLNRKIVLGLFCFGLAASQAQGSFPMASQRFAVHVGSKNYLFPYETSHYLHKTHEAVEHVIVSVHCSSFSALRAYRNAEIAIEQSGMDKENYLILAPHFLTPAMISERIDKPNTRNVLHWRENPFWGDSNGIYNNRNATVSSFDAIDQLLTDVVTSGHFRMSGILS